MTRHIAAIAVFALVPAHAWAQQCTSNVNTVVDAIYRQVLDRPGSPDASGWVQQLNEGVTVKEVIRRIAKSEEHLNLVGTGTSNIDRQRATIIVYDHILGRRATTADIREGSGFIQNNSVAAMIDGALASAEYTQKYGDWGVPGSNVVFCGRSAGSNNDRPRGTSGASASFERADRNRDGRITVSEWDDTRQAFRSADSNRDNVLSRDEYNAAVGGGDAVGTSGNSRNDQFDQLDANRNNRIERNEWRESAETFNWLDRNGDGWLSRGEVVGRR
jgi:Ca2+-binding EF-hand superfamily protein